MAVILSRQTNGNLLEITTATNPSLSGGTSAPKGSICHTLDGSEFIKFGDADTDWRDISDETMNYVNLLPDTNPPAPAQGQTAFTKNVGGRMMLASLNALNEDYVAQPHIGRNKITLWQANGNSTALTTIGGAFTSQGTATARTVATSNTFNSLRRLGYLSTNTAGNSAGTRIASAMFYRGDSGVRGGFHVILRFGISDASAVANGRMFCGLTSTTAVIGNVNPSSLTNIIGIGNDSGEANLQIMRNDGSGTATKIDLGANFPANTRSTDMFEFVIYCNPSGSAIQWGVLNLVTGAISTGFFSDDIPANTQLLALQLWRNNGSTALAVGLDIMSAYIETDL